MPVISVSRVVKPPKKNNQTKMEGQGGGEAQGVADLPKIPIVKNRRRGENSPNLNVDFRVARWFVFKPIIQIWVNFVGSCNG
jgi:hypothetical protein